MATVVNDRKDPELLRLLSHMKAVRENWLSVVYLKEALCRDAGLMFLEGWQELEREVQINLWIATTKGGVWTIPERRQMREWWGQAASHAATTKPAGGADCTTDTPSDAVTITGQEV